MLRVEEHACSRLHEELERLGIGPTSAMLVHALIDAGAVHLLECRYPQCGLASRAFARGPGRRRALDPARLVVDHVIPLSAGGSSRPTNLQLVHAACNAHKANHFDRAAIRAWRGARAPSRPPRVEAPTTGT